MPVPVDSLQVYPEALGPGTEIGSWRVVERLGVGGFGAVYRVEDVARPGEFYALKLALRPSDARAEREVTLLLAKAVHRHVVRFHGCGRWPHPRTGVLYFVMDWVEGRSLDAWAEDVNPCFREVARVTGAVALALDAVHRAGVVHRDVKPEHIRIREADGEPVLIDFGIGDYVGAATLTEQTVPPGTLHLRSPEAVRFHRLNHGQPGARYAYPPSDDLYALGVSLYRVVTGHFPFPPHLPPELLCLAIEGRRPLAPVVVNRRVPLALSDVLMRLLAKTARERFRTGAELHAALVAAVEAGPPSAWEACVFEWEERLETAWAPGDGSRRCIRRPAWPARSWMRVAPGWGLGSVVDGFRRLAELAVSVAGAFVVVGALAGRGRRLVVRGFALVVVVTVVAVVARGLWLALGAGVSADVVAPPVAARVREVAPEESLPEAARAAASPLATTSPVAAASTAALPKEGAPVTMPPKPPTPSLKMGAAKVLGVAGTCFGLACSGPQVRPAPPPEPCPPGALEAMEELGIKPGDERVFIFDVVKGQPSVITVAEGNSTVRLGEGLLYGRLTVSERVYGRFTWLRTHKGRSYPVCMELRSRDGQRGLERKPGGDEHSAHVWATGYVTAVSQFE